MTRVRVRGIYTTALTALLTEAGLTVVQASPPIRERFDHSFPFDPADVTIDTGPDRQGIVISGAQAAVNAVTTELEELAIDTFLWEASTPVGGVFDATVLEAGGGSGAVLDLGAGRRGYLRYGDVDGYVDSGDRYRVQVSDSTPPWTDDKPLVSPSLEVDTGLCTLSTARSGVSVAASGERASELVGMTDLLTTEIPDGWGLRWQRPALSATLEAMGNALEDGVTRVQALETALEDAPAQPGEPGELTAPERTVWVWFGRDSRFALDAHRRAVETTMAGHHRTKAATRSASGAVDFAEAICASAGADLDASGEFPFEAVSTQFGPTEGDRLSLGHGKPDGRLISLGTGTVTEWDADGSITLERELQGGGTYDGLGVPIESGDVAVTKLREGRWWYPTTYKDADGATKGTYVNVCTPVELFPKSARYVDLYIDVIRHASGTVEIVDDDELEAAVDSGVLTHDLADKARSVAHAVERALTN